MEFGLHPCRDDIGERSLPEPRRSEKQDVIERFLAPERSLDGDLKVLLHFCLTDEFIERGRTKRHLDLDLFGFEFLV